MATFDLSNTVDERTTGLRSLRRLINAPTQRVVEELHRNVRRLNADIYSPEELTKLLVPVVNEVLQQRIAASEQQVTATLAPIIDKIFAERTHQDKAAIASALAPTVAKALREQHEKFPYEVAEDLAPLIGAAIREQIRVQRDAMVDALYPIIGATIAKYMAEALRQLAENVNKRIENSFSLSGLMRKAKSKATGVSEAELILEESLPFSVEAAFLIHKSSGILISEAHKQGMHFDTDLVSGMLTAIRSFVNEWISRTGDVSEIETIEYGRSKIILEVAGHCYLAVVVDGEPPRHFIYRVRETLAGIISESGREIAAFAGELSFIPTPVHERIRSLIGEATRIAAMPKRSLAKTMLPLAAAFLLLITIPLGWYFYSRSRDRSTEQGVSSAIASSPGLTHNPIAVRADGDEIRLSGTLPNELLKGRAANAARSVSSSIVVEDAITLSEPPTHPVIAAAHVERVTSAFNTIKGVDISSSYDNGSINVRGTITDKALERKLVAELERLPGVASITTAFKTSKPAVEDVVYFIRSTEFTEDAPSKFRALKSLLTQNPSLHLRIVGYSDGLGTMAKRIPLTLARAAAAKNFLIDLGVAGNRLHIEGEGRSVPGLDPMLPENRCVRFEVIEPSTTMK